MSKQPSMVFDCTGLGHLWISSKQIGLHVNEPRCPLWKTGCKCVAVWMRCYLYINTCSCHWKHLWPAADTAVGFYTFCSMSFPSVSYCVRTISEIIFILFPSLLTKSFSECCIFIQIMNVTDLNFCGLCNKISFVYAQCFHMHVLHHGHCKPDGSSLQWHCLDDLCKSLLPIGLRSGNEENAETVTTVWLASLLKKE